MKTRFIAPVLLLSGMTVFGNAAMASDELAGALLGAGAGAVIGHSIDRHDGAVVGGFLGAILGAAIADDDDRDYRRPVVRPYPGYAYSPAVVYLPPRPRYAPPPIIVKPRPMPYAWHQDRYEYRDGHRDRDHDRGHDGRWDRDNDRGRDGRDGRRGW